MASDKYYKERAEHSQMLNKTFGRHWMFNTKRKEAIEKDPKVGKSYQRHYKMDRGGGSLRKWTPDSKAKSNSEAIKNKKS